jgi:hypothetical protein
VLEQIAAGWIKRGAMLVALSTCQAISAQPPSPVRTNDLSRLPRVIPDCDRAGAEGEIVVCGRRSNNERYRIPESLRSEPFGGENSSWPARQGLLEDAARVGRPGSNSPVGSYGQTGEREQMLREWWLVCPKVDGSWWKHKCRTH